MATLLSNLDPEAFPHRSYVMADTDLLGAEKASNTERKLLAVCRLPVAALVNRADARSTQR